MGVLVDNDTKKFYNLGETQKSLYYSLILCIKTSPDEELICEKKITSIKTYIQTSPHIFGNNNIN